MKVRTYRVHPLANRMPPMSREAYEELRDSIESEGQLVPALVTSKGILVDGRHRQRACVELGVQLRCDTKDFADDLEMAAFVIAMNLERRHLTQGQKVALRLKFMEDLDALRVAARENQGARSDLQPDRNVADKSVARELAKASGVSKRTAEMGLAIQKRAPALLNDIIDGKKTLSAAHSKARAEQGTEYRPTPSWVVHSLLQHLGLTPGHVRDEMWLDLFAGAAQLPLAMQEINLLPSWSLCEIRPAAQLALAEFCEGYGDAAFMIGDAFAAAFDIWLGTISRPVSRVLINPPFSLARQAVERVWDLCPHAELYMLQRINWIDQSRAEWLSGHMPDVLVLPRRVKFGTGLDGETYRGSDNCSHAWFHWRRHTHTQQSARIRFLPDIPTTTKAQR